MLFEASVIASLLVVAGTCAFLVGFTVFIYKDAHKKRPQKMPDTITARADQV